MKMTWLVNNLSLSRKYYDECMLKLALRDMTICFNVQRDSKVDYGFAHDGKHGMLCAQKAIITHPIYIHKKQTLLNIFNSVNIFVRVADMQPNLSLICCLQC